MTPQLNTKNSKLKTAHRSAVVNTPAINKRLVDLGYVVVGDSPQQFAAHIKSEIASLAKILKDVRID